MVLNTLLVLNLGLDVIDGVTCLHIEIDCRAGQCLDKRQHPTSQAQDKVQGCLLLVRKNAILVTNVGANAHRLKLNMS